MRLHLPNRMLRFPRTSETRTANDKNWEELAFWRREIEQYVRWYDGELLSYWDTPAPNQREKVAVRSKTHSAMLTWLRLHQQAKYLEDLQLDATAFCNHRVLDVGAGPLPSASVFADADIYCLDPLLPEYVQAGFPLHFYPRVTFVHGASENMPLESGFFDAVISVNAIDHVDDFERTANEIRRVLKSGGKLRIHAHYHRATATEPLELNDEVVAAAYGWCDGFRKIHQSQWKKGARAGEGEVYPLWSNFP